MLLKNIHATSDRFISFPQKSEKTYLVVHHLLSYVCRALFAEIKVWWDALKGVKKETRPLEILTNADF